VFGAITGPLNPNGRPLSVAQLASLHMGNRPIKIIGLDADDLDVRPQYLQDRCKRLTVHARLIGHDNASVSHDRGPASHVRGWGSTAWTRPQRELSGGTMGAVRLQPTWRIG
jgi:hypothetical protein